MSEVAGDNMTSELTCCGKTSFTKGYDFNQEELLILA